jgi:hypothetical protein
MCTADCHEEIILPQNVTKKIIIPRIAKKKIIVQRIATVNSPNLRADCQRVIPVVAICSQICGSIGTRFATKEWNLVPAILNRLMHDYTSVKPTRSWLFRIRSSLVSGWNTILWHYTFNNMKHCIAFLRGKCLRRPKGMYNNCTLHPVKVL